MKNLHRFWNHVISDYHQKPLMYFMMIGAFLRILAALFSQGYAMHDDHFVTIEPSYSWAMGLDYGGWLHQASQSENALFYNYLYPKFLSQVFRITRCLGLTDPKDAMLWIRLLHGFFSMLTVYFGYRIAQKLFSAQKALWIGWILSCYWLFPFIGVRNLVEVVCVPFIMMGFYFILSASNKKLILAAVCFSIASSIRFQTILLPIGVGMAWLYLRQYRRFGFFALSFFICFCLLDGILGLLYFHKPFGHIFNYIRININLHPEHSQGFFFKYSLILLAIGLSLGVHWGIGFVQSVQRKYILLSLPLLIFILVHSLIPNQQERFIFPILPMYTLLGVGCLEVSIVPIRFQRYMFSSFFVRLFWIFNCLLLLFFVCYYPKKSRVEVMHYFYSQGITHQTIVVDYRPNNYFILLPNMYMNYQNDLRYVYEPAETLSPQGYDNLQFYAPRDLPLAVKGASYLVLYDAVEISKRANAYRAIGYRLTPIATIESSFLDHWLHRLNPVNDEGTFFIYKLNKK